MSRPYLEHLARVPLFSTCSKRELGQLASRTTEVSVPAGRVLAREDSPGFEFFVIVSGRAVVTRDVPPHALVTGVPARPAGWMCQCGEPLRLRDGRGACSACGTAFALEGDALHRVDPPPARG